MTVPRVCPCPVLLGGAVVPGHRAHRDPPDLLASPAEEATASEESPVAPEAREREVTRERPDRKVGLWCCLHQWNITLITL